MNADWPPDYALYIEANRVVVFADNDTGDIQLAHSSRDIFNRDFGVTGYNITAAEFLDGLK